MKNIAISEKLFWKVVDENKTDDFVHLVIFLRFWSLMMFESTYMGPACVEKWSHANLLKFESRIKCNAVFQFPLLLTWNWHEQKVHCISLILSTHHVFIVCIVICMQDFEILTFFEKKWLFWQMRFHKIYTWVKKYHSRVPRVRNLAWKSLRYRIEMWSRFNFIQNCEF